MPNGYALLSDGFSQRFRVRRKGWHLSQYWNLHGVAGAGANVLREAWRNALLVGQEIRCHIEGLL